VPEQRDRLPTGGRSSFITTARLFIRPFTLDDAAFIVALLNDPDWLRFIGDRSVRSESDAKRYLENGPLAMYARHGVGLLAIDRLDDGATIGMCGLIRREGLDDVDLGFALLPEARGHGFAREAAEAVLVHGLRELRIPRIVAITMPANAASVRVLEAVGMRFERLVTLPADDEPLALYAIGRRA
jgi:RimJ/RimL family protein N-acetyltransferase